jgi:hypothetical protein
LACAAAYAQPGLLAPHEPDQGTRARHTDALAPLGSRKRASCCCPHWSGGGASRPTFVTALASDSPTPLIPNPTYADAPHEPHQRARVDVLHAPVPRVTHRSAGVAWFPSGAPIGRPSAIFCPHRCSAAGPGSETRQPEPLASHALLHGVRSCTSSPELPPVAYQIDAVAPTHFGGCQRCFGASEAGGLET